MMAPSQSICILLLSKEAPPGHANWNKYGNIITKIQTQQQH